VAVGEVLVGLLDLLFEVVEVVGDALLARLGLLEDLLEVELVVELGDDLLLLVVVV